MEGALASVVGGLTPAPVVAVPTSAGYGAAFEGVTALLAMLASCAAGHHRRRHRQRLRRGLRRRPDAAVSATGRQGRADGRLVPLLRRHRRRHGAREPPRRRRRPRRGPRLLERLAVPGWDLEVEAVLRGGVACTRAIVAAGDDASCAPMPHIAGLIEEAALPARVAERALAVFAALAEVEGRPAPAAARPGPLPRGRRPRRDRRHRRHGRGARGARRRRGDRVRRSPPEPAWCARPRPAAQSRAGGGPAARRRPDLRPRRRRRAHHPDRRRLLAAWPASFGPMPAMTVDAHRVSAAGTARARRPAELHPGRHRRGASTGRADRRRASRPCCSRPTSTTSPASSSPRPGGAPRRRRPRRLGHPGHHEEGPARTRAARAGRRRARRRPAPRDRARDRAPSGCGPRASSVGPSPRRSTQVTVDGMTVRMKVVPAGPSPSSTTSRWWQPRRAPRARGGVPGRRGMAAEVRGGPQAMPEGSTRLTPRRCSTTTRA